MVNYKKSKKIKFKNKCNKTKKKYKAKKIIGGANIKLKNANCVIYIFWTGNNNITPNRLDSINNLKKISQCLIELITKDNLSNYILKDNPLHQSYQYLSSVHKADYLRCYFMNFYGGGYSDIKKTTGSWKKAFDDLNNSNKYINGAPEIGPHGVAYQPNIDKWKDLTSVCAFICKPQSPLTKLWFEEVTKLLDIKLEMLKKYPAKSHRDYNGCKGNTNYPIGWNEMLGRIFHRITYDYKDKILKTVPMFINKNYI